MDSVKIHYELMVNCSGIPHYNHKDCLGLLSGGVWTVDKKVCTCECHEHYGKEKIGIKRT